MQSGLKDPLLFFRDMENLRSIIKNHLSEGIVLMDLIYNSGSDFVKVTVDSFDNITIKETSNIAKRIKNDDSILSMFPNGCRLEVTTPGIGSNLVKKFQYEKNIGRKISLKFYDSNSNIVSGIFSIVGVEDKGVIVNKSDKDYFIMFENIITARIKVSFD